MKHFFSRGGLRGRGFGGESAPRSRFARSVLADRFAASLSDRP